MNIAAIREKIRRAGFFIPFRVHLLLLVIALLLAARWLRKNNAVPETARTAIIDLFISVSFWFACCNPRYFLYQRFCSLADFFIQQKKSKKYFKNKNRRRRKCRVNQQVEVNISNIIKPLFGYIRLRLQYDGNNISPKFAPIALHKTMIFFQLIQRAFTTGH